MNRTVTCRTVSEIMNARQVYRRLGDKQLTIWLVCGVCNVIQPTDAPIVSVGGRIYCWSDFLDFLRGRLGRDATEEELALWLEDSKTVYGLKCFRNSKDPSDCVLCP